MVDIHKKHLISVPFPQGTDITVKAGDEVMQILCKISLDQIDGMIFWLQWQKDEIIRQEKHNAKYESRLDLPECDVIVDPCTCENCEKETE